MVSLVAHPSCPSQIVMKVTFVNCPISPLPFEGFRCTTSNEWHNALHSPSIEWMNRSPQRSVLSPCLSFSILSLIVWLCCSAVFAEAPYVPSSCIAGIALDWSSHQRAALGSDNFQLTWADDDHLYGAWGDGGGFGGSNSRGRVGLGVARIEGPAENYFGTNVWGGEAAESQATFDGKSWGLLSVDRALHMWVVPDRPARKNYRNHYEYIELASSFDHGANWKKADWKFTQSENLTIPTFLNFGRDCQQVPEQFGNYVYSYFIRPESTTIEQEGKHAVGLIVHRPGTIYLARVLRNELTVGKDRFEFYAGKDSAGQPIWGSIQQKQPVFQDENGVGWCISASYHATLKRVLLCTEHELSQRGLLGIFDSPTPWGPWTTVEYYTPASPFGAERQGSQLEWQNNVFFAGFATKWFDRDRFTLNFTGAGRGKNNDSFNTVQGQFVLHDN